MKIRHKVYEEVEGVVEHEEPMDSGWVKHANGVCMFYLRKHGWEEVPETRLVDVTDSVTCMHSSIKLYAELDDDLESWEIKGLPPKHNWRKVDRYDLPKDFVQMLNNSLHDAFEKRHTYPSLTMNWLQQFKKPSLIIESEEPCQ